MDLLKVKKRRSSSESIESVESAKRPKIDTKSKLECLFVGKNVAIVSSNELVTISNSKVCIGDVFFLNLKTG